MPTKLVALLLVTITCCLSQESNNSSLPLVISSQGLGMNGTCPSAEIRRAIRDNIQKKVMSLINTEVIPVLKGPPCACGGSGKWTRIAHLDMSHPSQQCPKSWNLNTTPVRGCGRSTQNGPSCDSVIFPTTGLSYSYICGRVTAYQKGSTEAFASYINGDHTTIESAYLNGVSLTHGATGSRQHIWSFPSAIYETSPDYNAKGSCPCINTSENWPYQVPTFIGDNYFCDTGNPGPDSNNSRVYFNDPLWDGKGCGPTNACCQFNTPPWFCSTLGPATEQDVELRICLNEDIADEDVLVSLVEIYIK